VLEQQPNNFMVANNLANLYADQHHPDALKMAKRAWKLNPKNINIIDTLGWMYVQNDKPEEGLRYLRDAQSRDSSSLEIQYHIAVALQKMKRYKEAKILLQKVLVSGKQFPGYSDAQVRLKQLSN
jgi:predicted Zn-dependent protease